jgi:hypothetical protein
MSVPASARRRCGGAPGEDRREWLVFVRRLAAGARAVRRLVMVIVVLTRAGRQRWSSTFDPLAQDLAISA